MQRQFHIKGVNPLGRVVQFVMLADTATDAKAAAEETGLKFVVVTEPVPPKPRDEGREGRIRGK